MLKTILSLNFIDKKESKRIAVLSQYEVLYSRQNVLHHIFYISTAIFVVFGLHHKIAVVKERFLKFP